MDPQDNPEVTLEVVESKPTKEPSIASQRLTIPNIPKTDKEVIAELIEDFTGEPAPRIITDLGDIEGYSPEGNHSEDVQRTVTAIRAYQFGVIPLDGELAMIALGGLEGSRNFLKIPLCQQSDRTKIMLQLFDKEVGEFMILHEASHLKLNLDSLPKQRVVSRIAPQPSFSSSGYIHLFELEADTEAMIAQYAREKAGKTENTDEVLEVISQIRTDCYVNGVNSPTITLNGEEKSGLTVKDALHYSGDLLRRFSREIKQAANDNPTMSRQAREQIAHEFLSKYLDTELGKKVLLENQRHDFTKVAFQTMLEQAEAREQMGVTEYQEVREYHKELGQYYKQQREESLYVERLDPLYFAEKAIEFISNSVEKQYAKSSEPYRDLLDQLLPESGFEYLNFEFTTNLLSQPEEFEKFFTNYLNK